MFDKQITYKNKFDGTEITDTYWFNVEASEIAEMKAAHQDDIGAYFRRIQNANNSEELIRFYRDMICLGVGIRVGNRHDKSEQVKKDFVETGAYNALFMELIQSPDQGVGFINDMFPQDLIEQYDRQQTETYTDQQLLDMSNAEFNRAAGDKRNRDKRMTIIAMKRKELNREKNDRMMKA
jgi:hypothetical protein